MSRLDPYTQESLALAGGSAPPDEVGTPALFDQDGVATIKTGGAHELRGAVDLSGAAAATSAPPVSPGYCSDHPDELLVTHKRARMRWPYWSVPDPATCCPHPDHAPHERERCRFCGIALTGRRGYPSPRRSFCSDKHRVYAFRAAAKVAP